MTILLTALQAAAVLTANTAPTMGNVNRYNASSATLTPTLPVLSTLNVGATAVVEKDTLDASFNPVTFTAAGSDTFDDGSLAFALVRGGEKRNIQVVSIGGTKYWKVTGGFSAPAGGGIAAAAAQVSLSNSTTLTQVIGTNAPVPLNVAATYRIQLSGTVQVASSSGTLTFTPLVVGTALAQTCQMPTQGSAAGPVAFELRYVITVRTTGTSGTVIAKPFGLINFSTPFYLTSTSASTTTINTASTSIPIIGLQAQWATANASNILLVDIATIERIT